MRDAFSWIRERLDRQELSDAIADIADDGKRAADIIQRLRLLFRTKGAEHQLVDVSAVVRGGGSLQAGGDSECGAGGGEVFIATSDPPAASRTLFGARVNRHPVHASDRGPLIAFDSYRISSKDPGRAMPALIGCAGRQR